MAINNVEIWTDGAAKGNPGPGGYGIVIKYKDEDGKDIRVEEKEAFEFTTNNKMEVLAAVNALKEIEKLGTGLKITLTSDSKYLVSAFNEGWVKTWLKEDFRKGKKNEVKNIDLWVELISLVEKQDITFIWVKGHNENVENERCDELANIAIKELMEEKNEDNI